MKLLELVKFGNSGGNKKIEKWYFSLRLLDFICCLGLEVIRGAVK